MNKNEVITVSLCWAWLVVSVGIRNICESLGVRCMEGIEISEG
jgi:hypothetical protein